MNLQSNPEYQHQENVYIKKHSLYIDKNISKGNISPLMSFRHALTLRELEIVYQYAHDMKIELGNQRGEWTSDFVNFDVPVPQSIRTSPGYIYAHYISRPLMVFKNEKGWQLIGGNITPVILPPTGWILPHASGKMYDEKTGTPFGTTLRMEKAHESGYAFFWRGDRDHGVVAVNRECERIQGSSFEISFIQSPDFSHENIGVREVFSAQKCLTTNYR